MQVQYPDFDQLDDDIVTEAHNYLTEIIKEAYPDADARRGIIGDTVCKMHALLHAANKMTAIEILDSTNLLAASQNPDEADPALVDRLAASTGIARKEAIDAYGKLTIIVDRLKAITLSDGAIFTSPVGHVFSTRRPYTVHASIGRPTTAGDLFLKPVGDGKYYFQIDIYSNSSDPTAAAECGDEFVPNLKPQGFVAAYAAETFKGGQPEETNKQLLKRITVGRAAKGFSGRENIKAMIQRAGPDDHPLHKEFSSVVGVSVIGMSDLEMTRDQLGCLPVSGGGCIDVYVRSCPVPKRKALLKTAKVLSVNDDGVLWQVDIAADDAPAFYEVVSIRRPGESTTTCVMVGDYRGGARKQTRIQQTAHTVYTQYQNATIKFLELQGTASGLVKDDTAVFEITVSYMPYIADIQEYLNRDDVATPLADVLVKAAIPCKLGLQIKLTGTLVDEEELKNSIASYINSRPFSGSCHSNRVAAAIGNDLPDGTEIDSMTIIAHMRSPNGEIFETAGNDIVINPVYRDGVSARTIAMFLDPSDIEVVQEVGQ